MDKLKGIAKGGWHPSGKDGKRESWRGDFKGVNTVAGWVGKGKDTHEDAHNHISRPLSSLKDPDAFGPPPKHAGIGGAATSSNKTTLAAGGSEAPVSQPDRQQQEEHYAEEEANRPPPAVVPYRADTTGLRTDNLPKPPARRMKDTPTSSTPSSPAKPKPGLPPRLPPRQDSHSDPNAPQQPPPYSEATHPDASRGQLNRVALDRLTQAGVTVPGFGIGQTASPPDPPAGGPQLNEVQQRFSRMNTRSTPLSEPPSRDKGTTWQQKQDALKTASTFRDNPSSISMSDATSAASTANNFRERHGEQVASGARTANSLNQNFSIANRIGGIGTQGPTVEASPPSSPKSLGSKKLAPPPPPKKRELQVEANAADVPPPLPLSSKPRPG